LTVKREGAEDRNQCLLLQNEDELKEELKRVRKEFNAKFERMETFQK